MSQKNSNEYIGIGGYTVIKNSWRGKYKRLMSITNQCITTFNPQTFEVTNSWEYSEVSNFANNFKSNNQEFILLVPKTKGKAPSNMYFQTQYIKEIMTDIYSQFRKFSFFSDSMVKSFNGAKITHEGKFINSSIHCTPASIEIWSQHSKKLIRVYNYMDICSLHQISDNSNGVVLQNSTNDRLHGLLVNDKGGFIQTVIDFSFKNLEIKISIGSQMTMLDFKTKRLGEYDRENSLTTLSFFSVEKFSKIHGSLVSRILAISENSLVDREPDTYNVVSIKHLSRIHSFYRSLENPQLFGIEWLSGYPKTTFYQSTNRDSLIATLLDSVRIAENHDAFVQSSRFHRHFHFNPLEICVDEEVEVSCMRLFTVAQPATVDRIDPFVIFNSNVPYTGLKHVHGPESLFGTKKGQIIKDAVNVIINVQNFSNMTTTNIENSFFALKRLFSSKAGFESFIESKWYTKLSPMVNIALKKNDHALVYSAIETLNSLIIPFHPNPNLYIEQENRISIFSHTPFITNILHILKENIINKTGSLVISAVLDFINFAICEPYSETTIEDHFENLIGLVRDIGYPLFRLFNHPSPSIVKSIGIIIKTLLDESEPSAAENIQEMALREGIFPKHLHSALFMGQTNSKTLNKCHMMNRQLSRKLLSYWVAESPVVKTLLYRSIPSGLVNCLYSNNKAISDALEIDLKRTEVELEVQNAKEFEVLIQSIVEDTNVLVKHWHAKIYKQITGVEIKLENSPKVAELRVNKPKKAINENWNLFYEKFYQDFYVPDLIWNHRTREELRDSLDAEIRALNIDEEIGTKCRISWNYEDFEVKYNSLSQHTRVGVYYLTPLLEKNKDYNLSEPKIFFHDLYNLFLKSTTNEIKILCLESLIQIYKKYIHQIGKFNDTFFIFHLLINTESKKERDLYIFFLRQLSLNKENCRILISCNNSLNYLIDLAALSHLHSTRAIVSFQTLMIEGSEISDVLDPVWYINTGKKGEDPVTVKNLKEKYDEKEIDENTKLWAHGMEGWKSMKEISQLKWTIICPENGLMDETELAQNISDIILNISKFFPNIDSSGAFVRPLPRCARYLSEVNCLPHLVQLLLTYDPMVLDRVASILDHIMIENPVLSKLFISGCYFFMLMYSGSNISAIAKFFKSTHLKQSFIGDDKSRNKIIAKSILSPILPEALISCLETYGHEKFTAVFLGEYNDPETIWSSNMRRHMVEKISVHLSDFIPKVKSNVKSIYMYCPIPKIEYEELENELFCGRYYLKHLCDTIKYPNWNIIEPLETLRDILNAWKDEVNKKPSSSGMTESEAYITLGLYQDGTHKQEDVRRAYLKLVSKYHPDKNPDGQEMFDKVVNAYEYICNNIVKKQTPSIYNVILLIKSQSILFVNCKKQLEPYRYSGYPLLISTIEGELKDQSPFSKSENENLLLPSVQLAHNTISCSALNAEELRRENGIQVLSTVFDRCINMITYNSEHNDSYILIIEQVIKCFTASSRFSGFIDLILEIPQIFENLNHILCHPDNLLFLCSTVVEFLTAMCAAEIVQINILKYGIVYELIYLLFYYDYTLDSANSSVHEGCSLQIRKNELANLSLQCISIMSTNRINCAKYSIQNVLEKLLTPYIFNKLAAASSAEILKTLNTNSNTPTLIWNNNTRNQLKKLLLNIRKYNPENEEFFYNSVITHQYEEDKDQLTVGQIYIYNYNNFPSTKINYPEKFALDLLTYIENEIQYIYSAISSKTSEDSIAKKIKYLYDVVLALYHICLQEKLGQVFQKSHIINLFSIFKIPECKEIQIVLLKILNNLTEQAECINKIAESGVIGYLNIAINNLTEERKNCISILHPLSYNQKIAAEIINKGTYIYLLDTFCHDKDIATRVGIIELFARLITDKTNGQNYSNLFQKFLPRLFIDAFLDNPQSSLLLYESNQENPELVWNDETRSTVSQRVRSLKNDLLNSQLNDPNYIFQLSPDYVCSFSFGEGLVIANVNVQRYISQPSWVLRHPKDFLRGLFEKLYSSFNKKSFIEINDDIETITTAICLLLECNSSLLDQMPNFGHLTKMITLVDESQSQDQIKSAIRIINSASKSKVCVADLCKNDKWLPSILKVFTKRPDQSFLAAEIINRSFSHEDQAVCVYVLKINILPEVVNLLKLSFSEIEQPAAARAHIVNGLQALEQNPIHGEKITQILNQIPDWKVYKFQKQDLFIEQTDNVLALSHNPAGYSGYLTAAQNTSSQSYSSTSTTKMILNTEPPLPPES